MDSSTEYVAVKTPGEKERRWTRVGAEYQPNGCGASVTYYECPVDAGAFGACPGPLSVQCRDIPFETDGGSHPISELRCAGGLCRRAPAEGSVPDAEAGVCIINGGTELQCRFD